MGENEKLSKDSLGPYSYSGQKASAASLLDCHFDSLVESYDELTEWRHNPEVLFWLKTHLPRSGRCIDLGTGTGIVARILQTTGFFLVGLDRSGAMLAKTHNQIQAVVRADAHSIPFRDSAFTEVSIRQLLHYTSDSKCVLEVNRITKPGGLVASAHISAPDEEVAAWWAKVKALVQPLRQRFYSDHTLINLFFSASMQVDRSDAIKLHRFDPWDRFLVNCPAAQHEQARDLVLECPSYVRQKINLVVDSKGVSYTQHWCLILARTSF